MRAKLRRYKQGWKKENKCCSGVRWCEEGAEIVKVRGRGNKRGGIIRCRVEEICLSVE